MSWSQLSVGPDSHYPEPPRRILRPFATMCVLILLSTSVSATIARGGDEDLLYDQLVSGISRERLMGTIKDLQDFGSRAFYLNSSSEVTAYLQARFTDLGLTVDLDRFNASTHQEANVLATLRGSSPSRAMILVGAHSDSENADAEDYEAGLSLAAPGADDDASGVAVMIELATVLADSPLDRTVIFAAFTAEEYGYDKSGGLAGSTHYATMAKAAGAKFAATFILDMVGYRGNSENHVVAVVNNKLDSGLRHVAGAVREYDLNMTLATVENRFAAYSDHFSFWSVGYPSVLLIESDPGEAKYAFNPNYHSANDTVDHLSEEQMTEVTKALLGGVIGVAAPDKGADLYVLVGIGVAVAAVSITVVFYLRTRRVTRHAK